MKKKVPTATDLRKQGFKVYIKHRRLYPGSEAPLSKKEADKLNLSQPSACGGLTEVEIYDENKKLIAANQAKCSLLDQYNKKIGRQIALGRAIKNNIYWVLTTS